MINRTEAERLAAGLHLVRPDWPTKQLLTLIGELRDWPLRDLFTALAYVAADRDIDGDWASNTPYRVKEQGPWLRRLDNADREASRQAAITAAAERREQIRSRTRLINQCQDCDENGYLPAGPLCPHETRVDSAERAEAKAQARAVAREALRKAKHRPEPQNETPPGPEDGGEQCAEPTKAESQPEAQPA